MAITYSFYHAAAETLFEGWDLSTNSFKVTLNTATAFTSTHTIWTDVSSSEIADVGYTAGGQAMTSVTGAQVSGVYKFDSADISWTAGAGDIAAADSFVYNDTVSDQLLSNIDFGATETAADGSTFVISPDATDGWFKMSVA